MTGDVVLDTSVVVAHLRGAATVTTRLQGVLQARRTLYLPLTAWGELLYGAYRAGKPDREHSQLNEFAGVTTRLSPTERTADEYARIKHELAEAGTPIPENDIWIAASAREHGLPLATCDRHFQTVAGLTIQDWRETTARSSG